MSSQVTFGGGAVSPGAYNFYTVVVSQAVTLGGNLGVVHDLTINAVTGSLAGGTNTITVGRNWNNSRGASGYSGSGAGTVMFNDNTQISQINGTTSFNNFSCTTAGKTIQFQAGVGNISAVGGSFTITGTSGSGNLINLQSQTGGSQWYFSVGGAKSVDYAAVSDSNYNVASITATNSADVTPADNTNWVFGSSSLTWTGVVSISWNNGGNWSNGYVPNSTDNVTINNGSSFNLDVGGLSAATTQVMGVTINGTVNATSSGSVGVQGNLVVAGTAVFGNAGATTWVMSGAGKSVSSSIGTSIGNLTVQAGGGNTVSLGSALSVSSLTLTSGTLAAGGNGLSVGGNITQAGGLVTSSGTVTLDGSAAQGVDFTGWTLTNLTVNNSTGATVTVSTTGITLGGNLALSKGTLAMAALGLNVAGNITQAGGAVTFTGAGTLTLDGNAAGQTADLSTSTLINLTVNSAYATAPQVSLAGNLTVSNLLTMTQGVLALGGNLLRLGTNLSLSSTNVTGIAIGTGTLDGLTNGKTITISNANASITQSTGTLSAASLTVSAGAYTLSGAGTVTLGAGGLVQIGGTITAANAAISSSGSVDVQAVATFIANTSTLTMSGPGTTIHFAQTPLHQPYDLTISAGGAGVAIATEALTVGNNLTISAGGLFSTANNNLTVAGSLTGAGALTAAASEAIGVGGNWGVTGFNAASSTVSFTGTGSVQTAATFYNLTIAASANVTLQAGIGINNTLSVSGTGTLNGGAGSFTITMNGAQWNNAGTFTPGNGTVSFTLQNAAQLSITGNNSWYNFSVTAASAAGKTIQFQHLMTQTIVAGGSFTVLGSSSSLITLTTDSPNATSNTTPPPTLLGQWVITNNGAPPNVNNAIVSWSYATNQIVPGANANDGGNNYNWIFSVPIVASWTLDTLNSGRINRIRVQVLPTIPLNNNFAGFIAQVSGYTVTGYQQVVPGTDVFDILLQQGPQEDTNATPTWQVTANTSLGVAGGALVAHNTAGTTKLYVAASGARPVITYSLAALGSTQAYVHFSEPVYGDDTETRRSAVRACRIPSQAY